MAYRQFFADVEHDPAGKFRYPGPPYRFSEAVTRPVRPAPRLGQHNKEVLAGEFGITTWEMERMSERGII